MKPFGRQQRDAGAPPAIARDVSGPDPETGMGAATADAILKTRVACLQEAIKRHGENDRRPVLVIAKEYETWCLTGDNTAALAAARAASEALQPAVADDKRQ